MSPSGICREGTGEGRVASERDLAAQLWATVGVPCYALTCSKCGARMTRG